MNVGGFTKHPNMTTDNDKHKGCFLNAHVSEVIVNTMKGIFEQWSES